VPYDRIVKGYELRKGSYVVIEPDELKALAPVATRTIEIEDFVDLDEIDPVYFEQPYYLAPDASAIRPYKLLVDAMTELRKVAVGRLVMRSKESLVAIRPVDGVLCLETMRYADEVLPPANVLPDTDEVAEPTERELEMARQLVTALTSAFEPDKYHDEYREQLLELIERKAAGEEIVAEPVVEEKGTVLDLMAALEASLARAGTGDAPAEADGAGAARPRAVKAVKPAKAAAAKSPAKATKSAAKKPAAKKTAKAAPAKATAAKSTRTRRSA
jgi:DNA end-binding protein Ku